MAGVIVRHYELAAEIAETHGGRMPRSQGEGDSTLTAFARATDAVEGALAFQTGDHDGTVAGGHRAASAHRPPHR